MSKHYLKEMRKRAKISRGDFATMMGVHETLISKWEAGNFPEKYEKKITEILKCSEIELHFGDLTINIEYAKKQAKETKHLVDENFRKKIQAELIKSITTFNNEETQDYVCEQILLLSSEANIEYLFFYTLLLKGVSVDDKKKIVLTFINALS